jgi:small neutral amino acid transporter SnatA (MarC family)
MNVLLNKALSIFSIFLDRGLFEIFGPLGTLRLGISVAKRVSALQTSLLFHYIYILVFNIVLFIYFFGVFFEILI